MVVDKLCQQIDFALHQLNELCPAVEHYAKYGGDVPNYVKHGKLLNWYERLCVAKCHAWKLQASRRAGGGCGMAH